MAVAPKRSARTGSVSVGSNPGRPARLTEEELRVGLERLPEWSESGDTIQRTVAFGNFVQAMAVVNQVAELAERLQHHPDLLVRYNKVTFTLCTHDAGGLTSKDLDLAARIDALAPAPAPA